MTHNEYVLSRLRQGPATNRELLNGAYHTLGEGITTHCRIADVRRQLKAQGEDIRCERVAGTRSDYVYEIVHAAGPVESPAVGHVALGAEIPAPVPDVIEGQLEMAL